MQVLFTVFVDHVLMQEVCGAGFDPSNLKIFMESLLQILIQITAEKNNKI